MLTSAVMTSVKGDITTERQFEQFLRDAGYSKKEATAIALHGFKAIDQRREADDGEQKLAELNDLHSQIQKLKEQFQ
jgi:hypothetical protein